MAEVDFYDAMQSVLQRPRYDILTGRMIDVQEVVMDAVVRFVMHILDNITINLPESGSYNLDAILTVFIIVVALITLGIAVAIAYSLLKHQNKKIADNADISELFDNISKDKFSLADLLRLSNEYANQKNFRQAARHYYIAVLVSLNNQKTIAVDKSKTNFQLKRELTAAAPNLSEPFGTIVEVFQKSWFGRKPLNDEQYSHFTVNVEEILREK
ncbi:MAG: DUF4129 domain-containing protein [Defluviitaleaceae bacterium]|nr:DUF4129 domain-containing protein [Defluviitaleaceae bacterium]